jgi:hypothetical protein
MAIPETPDPFDATNQEQTGSVAKASDLVIARVDGNAGISGLSVPFDPEAVSIVELAGRIGKAEHTIRQWLREGVVPAHLLPRKEGGRQKLLWREDQVAGMEEIARERSSRRGWQHPSS